MRVRAGELTAGLGVFDAVVRARSFHPPDRPERGRARVVPAVLRPGGALVVSPA
ncbi:hypothetical protein Shyhy01_60670 [Streptomyces hygroscopicus subsp. hygroscopicus]|nr:hypothetical protein [Streptomyces hygroscopicus]GLX53117.1 hypothetical protein Shyhy01_60670 [Streptomyces hygroscopicus subsp. hygroscopicus]